MNANTNEELDLFYTLKRLWQIGVRILKTTYVFCFTKWLWFAVAAAVALASSAAVYQYNASAYYSVIVLQPNALPLGGAINFANNHLAVGGDRSSMRHILNLSDSVLNCIKSISAHWGIDLNRDGIMDEIDMSRRCVVDTTAHRRLVRDKFFVCVRWKCQLQNWQQEIHYLNQIAAALTAMYERDDYIGQQNAARLEQKRKWVRELAILDSLQKLTIASKFLGQETAYSRQPLQGEKQYRSTDFAEMVSLIEQRLQIEQELALYGAPVSFVGYIKEAAMPQKADFGDTAWRALLIAFFATLCASLIWDKHKYLMQTA